MRLYHHQITEKIETRVGNPIIRQLMQRWNQFKTDEAMPPLARFARSEIPWCWDSVMVLQSLGQSDYLYVHYGDQIAEAAGFNLLGKKASHIRGEIGEFFREKYDLCVNTGRPLYTVHRADQVRKVQSWERLLLPLADAEGSIHVLAFNQPLEFKFDLLDSILRASRDGIVHLRAERGRDDEITDFIFAVVNPAAVRIAAMTEAQLVDARLSQLPPTNMLHALEPACREVMDVGRTVAIELVDPRPGRYAVFMINAVRTGDGVTVTLTNISSLKRQEQELRQALDSLETEVAERQNLQEELTRLATTDSLTGVLNRRELMRRSKREIAAARRYGRSLSLVIADIDHFKRVNDTYGHGVGDTTIRMFADICVNALRETDLVARIGGEEFVIVMPETPLDRAEMTADRLRRAVEEAVIPAESGTFHVTSSFGVAEWSAGDDSIEATLARADLALYEAKESGRNKVVAAPGVDPLEATPQAPVPASLTANAGSTRH